MTRDLDTALPAPITPTTTWVATSFRRFWVNDATKVAQRLSMLQTRRNASFKPQAEIVNDMIMTSVTYSIEYSLYYAHPRKLPLHTPPLQLPLSFATSHCFSAQADDYAWSRRSQ